MPFGLSNAPSSFMRLMNQILQPFLNQFIVVYFDDILYSSSKEDHLKHIQLLFTTLQENELQINLIKCEFLCYSIHFLGFIISCNGISVDPKMIDYISSWPQPKTPKDIQCFLGLVSFYRRFIKNFSTIAAPLTNCLKKGSLHWGQIKEDSFCQLKLALANPPVLKLPNFDKPFEATVDASGLDIGAVFSQEGHPLEYFSEKLSTSRQNWSTYEQELYALVHALKQWEHYLFANTFILLPDHFSLKFLNSQKTISRMHARWLQFLQRFNFVIKNTSGKSNKVADALSRNGILLTTLQSQIIAFDHVPTLYPTDTDFRSIWETCSNHKPYKDYHIVNNFLFKGDVLCVPHTSLRGEIIKEAHSSRLARHFG